jgi:hypothetical protein
MPSGPGVLSECCPRPLISAGNVPAESVITMRIRRRDYRAESSLGSSTPMQRRPRSRQPPFVAPR